MICVDAARNAVTCIGRLGENEAREVRINVSSIVRQFPGCTFTVLNKRPGDPDSYPVPAAYVRQDGENVLWTVTSGDLAREGIGQFEVRASVGGTVVKTIIYTSRVEHALDGSGEAPEPWEEWVTEVTDAADRAEAAAQLLENPGAEAETLEPGSSATASYADGVFTFGIPQGAKGDPGQPGQDGAPGRDGADGKDGAPGKDGKDGADGKDGKDGADGYTPVKGVDYWTNEDKAEIVADAAATVANNIIDDTAGDGDTNKTWSADKLTDLSGAINQLEATLPTEETAQELLDGEMHNTGLTDATLAVIGMLFDNLPQDETLTDILHSIELECERLDLIYDGWIAEREGT